MSDRHTMLRSMHDLGLAAWFGGSLMGALGVNGGAAQLDDARLRLPVASAGWSRWTPVNALAITAHLVGGAGELAVESPRVIAQSGVARMSALKTGLTVAALVVTGYSRVLGRRLERAGALPVEGTTEPAYDTPADVADCQRRMKMLQWAIPALTGALIVVSAYAGEQQKPGQVLRGVLKQVGALPGAARKGGTGLMMARRAGKGLAGVRRRTRAGRCG